MEERLIAKIVKFCRLLRRYGINVSYSEIVDALQAISEVGLEKEAFYQALKCTLIKDEANSKVFYGLFQLFFNPPNPSSKAESDIGDSLDNIHNKNSPSQGRTKLIEKVQGAGVESQSNSNEYLDGPLYLLLAKAVMAEDYKLMQLIAHKAIQSLGTVNPKRDDAKSLLKKAKENIEWNKAVNMLFGPNTF